MLYDITLCYIMLCFILFYYEYGFTCDVNLSLVTGCGLLSCDINFISESGINVLELGCGAAYPTRCLAENFPKSNFMASDISTANLGKARENCKSKTPIYGSSVEHLLRMTYMPIKVYNYTIRIKQTKTHIKASTLLDLLRLFEKLSECIGTKAFRSNPQLQN